MARERRKAGLPMYFEKTSPTRFSPGDPKMYCADEWATDLKSRQPAQVSDKLARATAEPRTAGEEKANRNTCQFKNRFNSLRAKDITFSNRNTKPPARILAKPSLQGCRICFLCGSLRPLRLGGGSFCRPCLLASVPLPYYGAIRRGVAVIPESHIGRQLHGD